MDLTTCPRATWFVELCELAGQHILNGKGGQPPAPKTSRNYNGTGGAVVDYILSSDPCHVITYDTELLEGFSDHILLSTALQVAIQPPPPPAATSTTPAATTYRWDVGATIDDQIAGIKRWKEHTNTEAFQQGMDAITGDPELTNEQKTTRMEQYLLEAGEQAGVVRECKLQPPLNPNRWGKHLAPWFDGACREAKK